MVNPVRVVEVAQDQRIGGTRMGGHQHKGHLKFRQQGVGGSTGPQRAGKMLVGVCYQGNFRRGQAQRIQSRAVTAAKRVRIKYEL